MSKVAERFIDAAGEALENVTGDEVKKYVNNNPKIQKWRDNFKEFRDQRRYNLNRRHVNAQF